MKGLAELILRLSLALREQVLPELGKPAGRGHSGSAPGGDVTFAIDEQAEQYLESFLQQHAPQLAFYSEDRGFVTPSDSEPTHVLIVDPIDGTRPAIAGLESACVAVAAAPLLDGHPTFADVVAGCVVEIKSGDYFLAERGMGVKSSRGLSLSSTVDLSRIFWTYGLRGRPVRPTMEVLAELIDRSSVGGAAFDLGSASFDMTRLLTGQLDAYIEPAPRMLAEVPQLEQEFRRVGLGHILNNTPYDLAAAAICLTELGAVVTDAFGEPLDRLPLLGSTEEFQTSCVTAASVELHTQLLAEVDAGISRLRALYS